MKPNSSQRFLVLLAGLLWASTLGLTAAEPPTVLVYTRNHVTEGKGYVHDNIPTSIEMIRKLGERGGFAVEASDDPAVFTDENLKKYRALIFSNSNNEAFENDQQREAFQRYLRAGGGFVGIHSACGSERKWPYFWDMLGGKFRRHPPIQPFTLFVIDEAHPATAHLGKTWEWEDEFYYLDHLNPGIHVLLAGDLASIKDPQKGEYPGTVFGDRFPLSWCQEFDGGREFYTALGHKIEYYHDPKFQKHVLGGILWAMGEKSLPE